MSYELKYVHVICADDHNYTNKSFDKLGSHEWQLFSTSAMAALTRDLAACIYYMEADRYPNLSNGTVFPMTSFMLV